MYGHTCLSDCRCCLCRRPTCAIHWLIVEISCVCVCVCVSSFTKRTTRYCWLLGENTKIMLQHNLQSVWRSVHHRMHPTQYIVYGIGPSWYEPRPGNDFENGQLCKFFFSFIRIFDKVHMRYMTICHYFANAIFRYSKYCVRETACVIRIISLSLPSSHCIAIATCTIRWQWTVILTQSFKLNHLESQ